MQSQKIISRSGRKLTARSIDVKICFASSWSRKRHRSVEQTASTSTYRNKKGLSASSSSNANRKKLTIPQNGPACMKKKQERHKTKADVKEELRNFRF
mmetsp:Transcript_28333/g.57024  ORF Transcript_28333/g.57024 Transcript_28333/m.57024 type:complete len:98 (-) Transcript_28333:2583-2876(-)